MTRLHGVLFIAAAVLAVAAQDKKDDAKDELKKFEGTWQLVSAEKDGEKLPEEAAKTLKAVVKGDKVTIFAGDRMVGESTLKVDPTKKPKAIDSTSLTGPDKGETMLGIYEMDGDTLKMCQSAPKKERPKEFDGKKGSGQLLATYKRVKP